MPADLLEFVANLSEGRDHALLQQLMRSAGSCLLDVHADPDHNRSVFTLAGSANAVEAGARELTMAGVGLLDLSTHAGVHPRFGAVDVAPFVALRTDDRGRVADDHIDRAVAARSRYVAWATGVGLATASYGPGGDSPTLPELRKRHRTGAPQEARSGVISVGARPVLVAYNLWLEVPDLALARSIASAIRAPGLRTLGLQVGTEVQVSCNLVDPFHLGPAVAYDAVAERTAVKRAEVVGLVPASVVNAVPPQRRGRLGLSDSVTIEARLQLQQPVDPLVWSASRAPGK